VITDDSPRRFAIALQVLLAALAAACRDSGPPPEVEVEVSRVALDEGSRSPVVLLENKAHTMVLPIWIGVSEAQAIAMEMEGVQPPRPLTHDLVKDMLDHVGVELKRVLITELRGSTYYARIYLSARGDEVEVDSRPSDAIALAVRFQRPIFVAAALLTRGQTVALSPGGAETASVAGVTVQALSPDLAEHFDIPTGQGLLVADVAAGAADGLQRGDVILTVDGEPARELADFTGPVAGSAHRAELSVKRGDAVVRVAFDARRADGQ
jgi:bifunctional DNase/RNase